MVKVYIYQNGDTYDGYWKKGIKSGKGKLIYSNGDNYERDY